MTRVLIVAKTNMGRGFCVGGLTYDTNENVRLIPPGRPNQPEDTPFEVGQVWELDFYPARHIMSPHTEDVIVTKQHLIEQVSSMRDTLLPRIHLWRGGPEHLFDGCLCLRGTGGYISATGSIPSCSTGYWLPDRSLSLNKPLIPDEQNNKLYYDMLRIGDGKRAAMLSIKYVGLAEPVKQISAGTLIRVSLARWFKPTPASEERCYLQLSGWYL